MIVAIDGITASGKGTLARAVAQRYGLKRLDTGALYRAVALALLDAEADPASEDVAAAAAAGLDLGAIDGARIRSGAVGAAASVVAAHPKVRAALLEAQRAFARAPQGAVLGGTLAPLSRRSFRACLGHGALHAAEQGAGADRGSFGDCPLWKRYAASHGQGRAHAFRRREESCA